MINELQSELGIPDSVSVAAGINGLPKIILTHESGSSAEIYLHGAHITSWKTREGEELIFLSRESYFEPSKPIRGGIPVIFPQFSGQGPLTQHGFARTSQWDPIRTGVADSGAVFTELALTESPESLAIWPYRFEIVIGVFLDERSLEIQASVDNVGEDAFRFQFALHTYFSVGSITQTVVRGLKGVSYLDSIRERAREVEKPEKIEFSAETDRIYTNTPDHLEIEDRSKSRILTIDKKEMSDVVVWNPWIDKSKRMVDFGDTEYASMVCVETGNIENKISLEPLEGWTGITKFSI